MKTMLVVLIAFTLTVSVGCASAGRNTGAGTALGAALGAGAGAIIGHQTDDAGAGAAIGAGLGALAGGLIGNSLDRSEAETDQALYEAELRESELSILDVIRMSQSGVSDQVIIAKIDQSSSSFDLSASDIIDLKRSSVSENVIEHMLRRSGSPVRAVQVPRTRVVRTYEPYPYWWYPRIHLHAGYHYYRHRR